MQRRTFDAKRCWSFRRSIALPEEGDAEKVSAEHKDGVLTIRLAKAKETQARRINVRKA